MDRHRITTRCLQGDTPDRKILPLAKSLPPVEIVAACHDLPGFDGWDKHLMEYVTFDERTAALSFVPVLQGV